MLQDFKDLIKDYQPYIVELRKKIVLIIGVFIGTTIIGLLFSNKIILLFLQLFNFSGVNVVMTNPSQLIDLSINTGLVCGVIITTPFFLFQIVSFLKSAFTKKENSFIYKILPLALILFIIGMIFGAWVTQFVITIYAQFSKGFNINNIWDIQTFFSQVIVTAVCMGVVFEMPVILTGLIRLKVIKRKYLVKQRRYVYTIIIIFAMLMPPTDPLSLSLITIPLWLLFEITLLLNKDY